MIYTNFTRAEGARRNLLTYTEANSNNGWGIGSSLSRVGSAISPDGTLNASTYTTTSFANAFIVQNFLFESGKTYTFSIYAKIKSGATPTSGALLVLEFDMNDNPSVLERVNLPFLGSGINNNWQRFYITATCTSNTSASVYACTDFGNGAEIDIWGAQLEVNGPTAYQPVVSGLEFNTEPLNHARIGYQNLTYGLTPTASTAAAGFPAIAATYPTTFEYWTPTALPAAWGVDFGTEKAVDYCGIVGDLNGATIEIQSSSNFSTWTTRGTIGPTTDRINMALFLETSVRYWRLYVTGGFPNIAVVYLGKALAMQRKIYQGHTPLTLSRTTELSNNMSDGGQYLGRSVIRKGAQTSCDWSHLTADWYRANFDPFVKSARTAPFFIGWRPESYPAELGYVWTDNDIAPQNTGPKNYMSVGVSFMGLINE